MRTNGCVHFTEMCLLVMQEVETINVFTTNTFPYIKQQCYIFTFISM